MGTKLYLILKLLINLQYNLILWSEHFINIKRNKTKKKQYLNTIHRNKIHANYLKGTTVGLRPTFFRKAGEQDSVTHLPHSPDINLPFSICLPDRLHTCEWLYCYLKNQRIWIVPPPFHK